MVLYHLQQVGVWICYKRRKTINKLISATSFLLLQRGSSQAAETNTVTSEEDVLSVLLEEHDLFVSSTRSRLTKLQVCMVLEYFWV
jgi:hypothetical protein